MVALSHAPFDKAMPLAHVTRPFGSHKQRNKAYVSAVKHNHCVFCSHFTVR